MIQYEYTEVNRLEKPHNYMYTAYNGREFLDAYQKDRLTYLDSIKPYCLGGGYSNYISLYEKSCRLLMDRTELGEFRDGFEKIFASADSNAQQSRSNRKFDIASLK